MTNTNRNLDENNMVTQADGSKLTLDEVKYRISQGPWPVTDEAGVIWGAVETGGEWER